MAVQTGKKPPPTAVQTGKKPPPKLSMPGTLALQILVVLGAIGAWQLAVELELARPVVLSSPAKVWDSLVGLTASGALGENLYSTLEATILALGVSVLVGVPVGLLLATLPRFERVMSPFIDALNASPRIALAPIFVVIFGLTQTSKVALAFSMVVFIILVNTRAGVRNADADVLALMASLGANRWESFTKVLLPTAIPAIFAGLRLGLTYALLGVVASELIAARDGVGTLIAQYSAQLQTGNVYALILVLIVVASFLNSISAAVERRLLRWQPRDDS